MKKSLLIVLLLFFSSNLLFASKSDSLLNIIKSTKNETKLLELYSQLGTFYFEINKIDSSSFYYKEALIIAKKYNNIKSLSFIYRNLGLNRYKHSKYQKAIEYMTKSISYYEILKDSSNVSDLYNNIGIVYLELKDYFEAIKYLEKSLDIKKAIGDNHSVSLAYVNIGTIYLEQNNDSVALEYFLKPLDYFKSELNGKDSSNAMYGIAICYNNIAQIKEKNADFNLALKYYRKSLKYLKKIDDKQNISLIYINYASVYLRIIDSKSTKLQKDYYKKIELTIDSAITISEEINAPYNLQMALNIKSELLYKQKRFKEAFLIQKQHFLLKDSILNIEKLTAIEEIKNKLEVEKAKTSLLDKDLEIKKNGLIIKKKNQFINIGIALLIIVVAFILIISIVLRKYRKTNKEVELVNKEINESLNLARYLQKVIIGGSGKSEKQFDGTFAFFQPKQIVGGDFIWSKSIGDKVAIAVADCVGHGVPGAMISMLSVSYLNDNIYSSVDISPASILNKIRALGVKNIINDNKELSMVGLDMGLIIYNSKTLELEYSGAHIPLYIVSDNDVKIQTENIKTLTCKENNKVLTEIKADRMSLGINETNKDYTNNKIQLKKGDIIYLSTDGFADQFGGSTEGGKKYKYLPFKKLLLKNSHLPMKSQKELLSNTFFDFMGNNEQVDDVTVLGLKV